MDGACLSIVTRALAVRDRIAGSVDLVYHTVTALYCVLRGSLPVEAIMVSNDYSNTSYRSVMHAFWRDQRGATAIEYALVAGSIAVVIIVVLSAIGVALLKRYEAVAEGFKK